MNINNQFQLFFYTRVYNWMGFRNQNQFERFERIADGFLSESRYWLRGNEIRVHPRLQRASIHPIDRNYTSFVAKISSLVIAILGFIPGILIKACNWSFYFSYVNQRNRIILESIRKQSQLKQQCDPRSYVVQTKQFHQQAIEQNHPFHRLPDDLGLSTLSFLNGKDVLSFAHTCQKNYALAVKFSSRLSNQCREYPDFIINALGKAKLAQLPVSVLPQGWQILFQRDPKFLSLMQTQKIRTRQVRNLIGNLFITGPTTEHLASLMKNNSIQKIQLPEGPALIIRIKDNSLNINEIQTFVIAKVKEKWEIITSQISPEMWMFLSDLHFHKDVPLVFDYLRRLFNGEPCGNFPFSLNRNQEDIPINFQQEKASEILNEGPRLLPDGITPVIQLWPTPPAQNL